MSTLLKSLYFVVAKDMEITRRYLRMPLITWFYCFTTFVFAYNSKSFKMGKYSTTALLVQRSGHAWRETVLPF
jgi:hypothetical protein